MKEWKNVSNFNMPFSLSPRKVLNLSFLERIMFQILWIIIVRNKIITILLMEEANYNYIVVFRLCSEALYGVQWTLDIRHIGSGEQSRTQICSFTLATILWEFIAINNKIFCASLQAEQRSVNWTTEHSTHWQTCMWYLIQWGHRIHNQKFLFAVACFSYFYEKRETTTAVRIRVKASEGRSQKSCHCFNHFELNRIASSFSKSWISIFYRDIQ